MPSNKQEYLSDALFSESEHPSRVYIMLVETSAYLGSYTKSPFHFGRKWTVEAVPSIMNMPSFHHVENIYLKNALDEMKSQMMYLIKMNENKSENTSESDEDSSASEATSEKNKKRRVTRKQPSRTATGKGKKNKKKGDGEKNSRSFWNPFSKFPRVDNQDNQSLASSFVVLDDEVPSTSKCANDVSGGTQGDGADPTPPAPIKTKTTYWLTKCQLELNSAPINQVIIKYLTKLLNI